MTQKTFQIEVKADFQNAEIEKVIIQAARTAAKQLYTTALLVTGKGKVDVSIQSHDFFEGAQEIDAEMEKADSYFEEQPAIYAATAEGLLAKLDEVDEKLNKLEE